MLCSLSRRRGRRWRTIADQNAARQSEFVAGTHFVGNRGADAFVDGATIAVAVGDDVAVDAAGGINGDRRGAFVTHVTLLHANRHAVHFYVTFGAHVRGREFVFFVDVRVGHALRHITVTFVLGGVLGEAEFVQFVIAILVAVFSGGRGILRRARQFGVFPFFASLAIVRLGIVIVTLIVDLHGFTVAHERVSKGGDSIIAVTSQAVRDDPRNFTHIVWEKTVTHSVRGSLALLVTLRICGCVGRVFLAMGNEAFVVVVGVGVMRGVSVAVQRPSAFTSGTDLRLGLHRLTIEAFHRPTTTTILLVVAKFQTHLA